MVDNFIDTDVESIDRIELNSKNSLLPDKFFKLNNYKNIIIYNIYCKNRSYDIQTKYELPYIFYIKYLIFNC